MLDTRRAIHRVSEVNPVGKWNVFLQKDLSLDLRQFLIALTEDQDVKTAWERSVSYFAKFDINVVNYAYGNTFNDIEYLSTAPSSWREQYRDSGFARFDPLVSHCVQRLEPVLLDAESLARDSDQAIQTRHLFRKIVDVGWLSSIAVPLRGHVGAFVGGLGLVSGVPFPEFEERMRTELGAIVGAAWPIHYRLQILLTRERAETFGLTRQELKCLFWLSGGLKTEQIAHKLEISRATVDFHFKNARTKLGAATREEALTRAVRAGLINL